MIGHDFYENQLFDNGQQDKIRAFDWRIEFSEIFKQGGFDAVIGNPPWISLSGKFGAGIYPIAQIEYLIKNFDGNTYMPNMYEYFVAQGLTITKNNGYFSFIVPDRLGFNRQFINLRRRILTKAKIISLLYKIPFPGITADTLIFVLLKGENKGSNIVNISEYGKIAIEQNQKDLLTRSDFAFVYFENQNVMTLA